MIKVVIENCGEKYTDYIQSQQQPENQGYIIRSFIEMWEGSKKIRNVDIKVIIFPLNLKAMLGALRVEEG